MGGRMFSVKMVAGSAAVLSAAVALRLAMPAVSDFLAAEAPRVYGSVAAWLTPPYLYFVINGIILSIAATSRFQKSAAASVQPALDPVLSAPPPPISTEVELLETAEYISKVAEDADLQPEFLAPAVDAGEAMNLSIVAADPDPEPEEFVISRSNWSPSRRGSSDPLLEKSAAAIAIAGGGTATERPSVSVRLGRRRSIKSSPEGKALGVTRPRKHETLESTWRTITDGRAVPLARHHKKSDTWDMHARSTAADPAVPAVAMRKSETFAAAPSAAGFPSPSSGGGSSAGKLRREPSLGQDDLNRRVEAFINKFNEEMRLQRQQSLQQYMDMINRSSH